MNPQEPELVDVEDAIKVLLRSAISEQAGATKLDLANLTNDISQQISELKSRTTLLQYGVAITVALLVSTYGVATYVMWRLMETLASTD